MEGRTGREYLWSSASNILKEKADSLLRGDDAFKRWERRAGGRWRRGRTVLDNKKLIRKQCPVITLLISKYVGCLSFIESNTFFKFFSVEEILN